jgi:hypothetical protein
MPTAGSCTPCDTTAERSRVQRPVPAWQRWRQPRRSWFRRRHLRFGHLRSLINRRRSHLVGHPALRVQPDAELRDARRPPDPVPRRLQPRLIRRIVLPQHGRARPGHLQRSNNIPNLGRQRAPRASAIPLGIHDPLGSEDDGVGPGFLPNDGRSAMLFLVEGASDWSSRAIDDLVANTRMCLVTAFSRSGAPPPAERPSRCEPESEVEGSGGRCRCRKWHGQAPMSTAAVPRIAVPQR